MCVHIRVRMAQYSLQVQERFTCTRTVTYEMSRTSYSARARKIKCARWCILRMHTRTIYRVQFIRVDTAEELKSLVNIVKH